MHTHSPTVSAGNEHMVEEGKGSYRSVRGGDHHKLFRSCIKEKKKLKHTYVVFVFAFFTDAMKYRYLLVLQRSVDHGHEDVHGHGQTHSSGHEHRRHKEQSKGALKAE